jgi:hypothetical protein
VNEAGSPLLLHTTYGKGNVVWPLDEFSRYRRYGKFYGVSRLVSIESTLISTQHAMD